MDLVERINCYRFDKTQNEWILQHELPEGIQIAPHGHGNASFGKYYPGRGNLSIDCHWYYDTEKNTLHISPRYDESMNLQDLLRKSETFPEEGVYIILDGIAGWQSIGFQKIRKVVIIPWTIDVQAEIIPKRKGLPG